MDSKIKSQPSLPLGTRNPHRRYRIQYCFSRSDCLETQTMKSPFPHTRMPALAYLYDHVRELPAWFQRLTACQLHEIADLMVQWNVVSDNKNMLTMEQIERREVLRVLALCDGNIAKAANVLKMGKTTIYRKLVQWGLFRSEPSW
jgi:DNA-binding protein Fis